MKRSIRVLCLLLALILIPIAAPAEGELTHAAKALYSLLFDMDNVTLALNAEFSWEGEWFKTFSGTHRQQGTSSRMEVSLTTPRAGWQPYTGGYTVTSVEGITRSAETYYPSMYSLGTGPMRASVLTDTALRRTVGWLFTALLAQAEAQLPPYAVTEKEDGGTSLHVALKPGETPDVLNAALTLVAEAAAKKFLGADFDLYEPEGNREEYLAYPYATFRDWEASFASLYRAEYGQEMPVEDLVGEWPEEDPNDPDSFFARYDQIAEKLKELRSQTEAEHPGEFVVLAEDNSVVICPDFGSFVRETESGSVWFINDELTFLNWYNARDPEHPLTHETIRAIENSIGDLNAAYWELRSEMYQEYYAVLTEMRGAQGLLVLPGGTCVAILDLADYMCSNNIAGWSNTLTGYLQLTARKLEVSEADVTVELDQEGRLAGVSGSLSLSETDVGGWAHPLDVTFEARAEAYGATTVEQLDLTGLVTSDEYYANYGLYSQKDFPEQPLPETVVLNGVTYPLKAE